MVTSFSLQKGTVNVLFLRNAAAFYGEENLSPATAGAVGIDLRACLEDGLPVSIPPGERRGIGSGMAIEPLMPGIAGFVYSRSGLGAVRGLTVAQGVGLIDPDYRGEIIIFLLNTGAETYTVQAGERIAQLVFQPYIPVVFNKVNTLAATERGVGGFGHTGKK